MKRLLRILALIMSVVMLFGAVNFKAYAFDFPVDNDLTDATFNDICRGKAEYEDMTIYCYYQRFDNGYTRVSDAGGIKPTAKNRRALATRFSCGVYAPCIAASAITGKKILPQKVISKSLKRKDIHNIGGGYNTVEAVVAKRLRSYLRKHYNYELSYKVIDPKKADKYLDKGFFTVILVNKTSEFTHWRHWMVLISHNPEDGTVVVANSNNPDQFMKSYKWKYVKSHTLKRISKQQEALSVAYRWKFDDTAEKTEIKKVELIEDTKVYEHIYGKNNSKHAGYFATISKGKKYKVVGVKDDYYKIKAKTVDRYYFIQKDAVKDITGN